MSFGGTADLSSELSEVNLSNARDLANLHCEICLVYMGVELAIIGIKRRQGWLEEGSWLFLSKYP
jgi:hypothetical protein